MPKCEETPAFRLGGWTKRLAKAWRVVVALTFFASVHSAAVAHDMPSSLIVVRAGDRAASVDVIIPWPELAVAISQLPAEAPETLDASARTRLGSYLVDHIALETSGGQIWQTNVEFIDVVGGSDHRDLFHTRFIQRATLPGKYLKRWWARQGLNLRPHPCEGCALPLSYAPAGSGGGNPAARQGRAFAMRGRVRQGV